jgi:hypothetical protein
MGQNDDNGFKFRKDLTLPLGLDSLNLPRVNEPDVFHLDLPIPPNLPFIIDPQSHLSLAVSCTLTRGTLQHPRICARILYATWYEVLELSCSSHLQ